MFARGLFSTVVMLVLTACSFDGARGEGSDEPIAGEGASTTDPPRSSPNDPPPKTPGTEGGEPHVDMQDILDKVVAKNPRHQGGGVLRVATAKGVIFEGASGDAI